MSSNNNDQNFDDENGDEHDFYQLVLAGCAAAIKPTSFKEKKTLQNFFPHRIQVCNGCLEWP